MSVYVLTYANCNDSTETFSGVYKTVIDAKVAAIDAIHQIFEDDPWMVEEEGYHYDDTIQDNGDWVVSIFTVNGEEVEWWRVTEQKEL